MLKCDAPPHSIVLACEKIGVKTPADSRWIHVGNCSCGEEMPRMNRWQFTYDNGRKVYYLLGQCPQCRTVYWCEILSHP